MKSILSSTVLALIICFSLKAEIPATIVLKSGEAIHAIHFGQLECSGSKYTKKEIIIKGIYMGVFTEVTSYADIAKIELMDFTLGPVQSVGNQKGTIIIYKKNGISATLEQAELVMTCYGVGEKFNQIEVQMINPLTNKVVEKQIDVKEINYITFP